MFSDNSKKVVGVELTTKSGDKAKFTGNIKNFLEEAQSDNDLQLQADKSKRYTGISRGELIRRHEQLLADPFYEKEIHEQILAATPKNFFTPIVMEDDPILEPTHSFKMQKIPIWIQYENGKPLRRYGESNDNESNDTYSTSSASSSSDYSNVTKNSSGSKSYLPGSYQYKEEDFPSLG